MDTSRLGMGVMIKMLGSNADTIEAIQAGLNKRITDLRLVQGETDWGRGMDALRFTFDDGTEIDVYDGGQSCCESRYMKCEHDLAYFTDTDFRDIEVRYADPQDDEDGWGVHEIAFLTVTTGKGVFTIETHNEHNGYYGGFYIEARVVTCPAQREGAEA